MTARNLLMPGTIIGGRYTTLRTLGTGGMGAVYEATDGRLGHRVALKLMTNGDERAPAAFEQEARLLASLHHAALPRVSDYFIEEHSQYLVMEYVDGLDLEKIRHERNGRIIFRDVFRWVLELLDVLEYLHTRTPPVVHRDIKPANIKVTPEGSIYLLDFGLAKGITQASEHVERSLYAYTAQYAPPEQIFGVGTEPRTDLFSLAATVYCLLTGNPPVDARIRNQVTARHEPDPLQRLTELDAEVPASFSDAIAHALALDVTKRPASAIELRALLIGADMSHPLASYPSSNQQNEATTVPVPKEASMPAPPMRRAIWFDPAERTTELLRLLDTFMEDISTEQVRSALGRETLGQIRIREQQIRSRLNEPFTLIVMGDFKRGKSTLVNALLGRELAPANITPETVTINRFTYGPELSIVAHLANGARMQLALEDLRVERLEVAMRQLSQPILYVTIEAPIPWLEGIQLVDMPGTGDVDWRFDAQVQSYLPQADAILYVVSARAPLSASEQAFLRRAVAPQEFPKLLFIVNQIDAIRNEADVERVIDLVRTRVDQVFPGSTVYGVSGLDEIQRKLGRTPPQRRRGDDLAARFTIFQRELNESVLLNRDIIRIDRAIRQAHGLVSVVVEQTSRLRSAMDRDKQQLHQAINQCEDANSALRQAMQEQRTRARTAIIALGAQTHDWMDRFINRVHNDVVSPLHHHHYADVQRHLTFFLQDSIGQALAACVEAHQAEIATILDQTRSTLSTVVADQTATPSAPKLNTAQAVAQATYNQATWSNVDTIHYIASFAQQYIFGSVGQMTLAVVFAAADKKADDTTQLRAYQEQLRKALPGLREALQREIDALYLRLANEVDTQINSAYEADVASALATLRQAETIQQSGNQRIQEVSLICDGLITNAHSTREQLVNFQSSLWQDDLAV